MLKAFGGRSKKRSRAEIVATASTSFSVRRGAAEEDEFGVIFKESDLPSDTLARFQSMRQEFPIHSAVVDIPVMLEHHIYGYTDNRTKSNQELEFLVANNILRRLHVTTGDDEMLVVFNKDYKGLVRHACDVLQKKRAKTDASDSAASANALAVSLLDVYERVILDKIPGVFVTAKELETLYARHLPQEGRRDGKTSKTDAVGRREISTVLREHGFLMQRSFDNGDADCGETYWLSIPRMGKFVKQVIDGRKKIMRIISKRPFKEILELELLQRRVKDSDFNIQWYVRDLMGRDDVTVLDTTSGKLIRLPRR